MRFRSQGVRFRSQGVRLRVLFLETVLNDRGGAGRWLLDVASALHGEVDLHVAAAAVDPLLPPDAWRGAPPHEVKGLDRKGLGTRGRRATLTRLDALLDQVAPDVVHVNYVLEPAALERVAATGRGVLTVHDHRLFCPARGKVLPDGRPCHDPMGPACSACFDDAASRDRMIDVTARRLDAVRAMARVVVVSGYMHAELAAAGVPPERLVLARPFVAPAFVDEVDRERARRGTSRPPFHVFSGRLAWQKGLREALAASTRLGTSVPLLVAGDGPLAPEVAAAAAAHPGRVRGLGWLPRLGLARLLAHARSLWFPSLWIEPFGLAGLEAAAAGVPVVATGGGGVDEWLEEGINGLRVPRGDADALAAAADALASDPGRAQALGEAGRAVAARFRPQAGLDALRDTWRRVAG